MSSFRGIILILFFSLRSVAQTDTFHVYFATDVSTPDTTSIFYLQNHFKRLDTLITIVGYADERGDNPYNKRLSMDRAKNIAKALIDLGLKKENIVLVEGKGEVSRDGNLAMYEGDRRVDIVTKTVSQNDTIGMVHLPEQLLSIPVGSALALDNMYFYIGTTIMTDASIPRLQALFRTLNEHPSLYIRLEGHVCCLPPGDQDIRAGGLRLSLARAETMRQYLVDNGIEAERIDVIGFGMDKPLVAEERTEEDRRRNRRVEVRVISK